MALTSTLYAIIIKLTQPPYFICFLCGHLMYMPPRDSKPGHAADRDGVAAFAAVGLVGRARRRRITERIARVAAAAATEGRHPFRRGNRRHSLSFAGIASSIMAMAVRKAGSSWCPLLHFPRPIRYSSLESRDSSESRPFTEGGRCTAPCVSGKTSNLRHVLLAPANLPLTSLT